MFGMSLTTTSKYERPAAYNIQLEKQVYFPGETLRGTLLLTVNKPVKCRGVRVHLQGKGQSHLVTGSGDNRHHHHHTQYYTNCKRTVFGAVHKTPVLNEVGENAIFGPPWALDEGVLLMHVPPQGALLVLQAMDYAWEKRDALLGEALVDVDQCVGKGQMQCALMRNGKPESGSIFFQIDYDESHALYTAYDTSPLSQTLRVQIFRATGLRSAEWFGKNDVYVRAYFPSDVSAVVQGKALPSPEEYVTLPAGELRIPFSFRLPVDLPSSIVRGADNSVSYSVYSNIDISWKADPSTRTFFTVMQSLSPLALLHPLSQDTHVPLYQQCCIPPLCCIPFSLDCGCDSLGTLHFSAGTDRAAYAPGESIRVWLRVQSEYEGLRDCLESLTLSFQQHMRVWADGHVMHFSYHCASVGVPVHTLDTHGAHAEAALSVPAVSPTYLGRSGQQDAEWFQSVARYGARWTARPDPLTWQYTLTVRLGLRLPSPVSAFAPSTSFAVQLPITVCALGLSVLGIAEPPLSPSASSAAPAAPVVAAVTAVAPPAEAAPPMPMPMPAQDAQQPVHAQPAMSRGSAAVVPLNSQGFDGAPAALAALGGYGGYAPTSESDAPGGETNLYGGAGAAVQQQWAAAAADDAKKQAQPALNAQCTLAMSQYERATIRDAQEDCNPQNVAELAYQPVFLMSPPARR